MSDAFAVFMLAGLVLALASGCPLVFALGGLAVIFGFIGWGSDCLVIFTNSIFGTMNNASLTAVPLFVLMANFLTASKVTEGLFTSARYLLGTIRGGVALAVILVATIFAACTGVVGASVVTIGLLSTTALLQYGYDKKLLSGLVCAGGSLGILIPPSIMLVVMASTAQISVGKLFLAALLPGIFLSAVYAFYILFVCWLWPEKGPALSREEFSSMPWRELILGSLRDLLPPALLILGVLGSIYTGTATPTEASGVGAGIALLLAFFYRQFSIPMLRGALHDTARTSSMCIAIIIGAGCFTNVFLGLGGDEVVTRLIETLGLGRMGVFWLMMGITFIMGCFLDWMGIVMILLPIFLPIMREFNFDMIWLMTCLAVMLQTCFLTPPFGFALFYFKGVAGDRIPTKDIYIGILPFVALIICVVVIITIFPDLVTWLPSRSRA
jgi:tripartite ATP-independent transporter DctM subunit